MRYLILFLICILSISFKGNNPKNDVQRILLKGPVRSVIEYKYYTKRSKAGNLIEDTVISEKSFKIQKDSIEFEDKWIYNEKGQLLESYDTAIKEHRFHDSAELNSHFGSHQVFSYNDSLRTKMQGYIVFHGKTEKTIDCYKYIKRGHLVMLFDSSGRGNGKTIFRYNLAGTVNREKDYYAGHLNRIYRAHYKQGKLKSEYTNQLSIKTKTWHRYKSDKPNTYYVYSKERSHLDKKKWINWFKQDSAGLILQEKILVSWEYRVPENDQYQYNIYKYLNIDSHGNWLKRVEITNDTLVTVTEREIEYFK